MKIKYWYLLWNVNTSALSPWPTNTVTIPSYFKCHALMHEFFEGHDFLILFFLFGITNIFYFLYKKIVIIFWHVRHGWIKNKYFEYLPILIFWYLKVLTCNKLYYPLLTSISVDIKVFIFILVGYCVMLNNYGWKKLQNKTWLCMRE
jgi:hypothetical protein